MLVFLVLPVMVSCGDDGPVVGPNQNDHENLDESYGNQLRGTSWKQVKKISQHNGTFEEEKFEGIMTFGTNNVFYIIGMDNRYNGTGTWEMEEKDKIRMKMTSGFDNKYNQEVSYGSLLGIMVVCGFRYNKIDYLTDTKMQLSYGNNDGTYSEFIKVPYQEGNSQGGGGGGGSTGERPYITSYNYSATRNSITVTFMCDERPTSATVKYGTSTPTTTISSTISGKQVSATVNGLKAGTKYYFKCTVSNQYGSSNSDVVSAMTNY